MTEWHGSIKKMSATVLDSQVQYSFRCGESVEPWNSKIGHKISLQFTGKIFCVNCGRQTKKSFQNGYCYPCTLKLAETDLCIVKPELCHHHKGTCRDNEFAQKHCFIPHVVYAAFTSDIKVGITRAHQKLTRWVDQGAVAAIEVAIVPNRLSAGLLEVEIAKTMADKTNWRKLLAPPPAEIPDLFEIKQKILTELPGGFEMTASTDNTVQNLNYPVTAWPIKINSYNLDKNPLLEDKLMGIRGQYMIFQNGVINMRKYSGYEIDLKI